MEKHYGWAGDRKTMVARATFFRNGKSTFDLEKMSKEPFDRFIDTKIIQPGLFGPLDEAGGCSESCDIYAD